MLKQTKPTLARRLAGGTLIAVLGAAGGYAAWAAAPEAAPAAVEALAILPAPVSQQNAPAGAVAAPTASPTEAPAQPALTGAVCLTNACGEPAPVVAAETSLPLSGPPITDLGARQTPLNSAFATYFDANKPMLLKGPVVEINTPEGGRMEIIMRHAEDPSRVWRVEGGAWTALSPEQLAAARGLIGQDVVIRAYGAHDTSCVRGCIANGRDVSRPDGSPVFGPPRDAAPRNAPAPSAP